MQNSTFDLEAGIADWKKGLRSTGNLLAEDENELESHLRDEIDDLRRRGLSEAEAFLIGIRRLGSTSELAREYYKINGRRLWKQLEVPTGPGSQSSYSGRTELLFVCLVTLLAALAAQLPYLFGASYTGENLLPAVRQSLFLFFPFISSYLIWKRRLSVIYIAASVGVLVSGILIINLYPFRVDGDTILLSLVHLALLFWALFGLLYTAHGNKRTRGYVDFLRYSGELFIYTVLVGLGGAVLLLIGNAIFAFIGIDVSSITEKHIAIAGIFGAPIVATYLVEAKRNVIENIAPVLAKLFVPLFFLVLLAFLVAMVVTGTSPFLDREPLIVLDLLLFLVLAMVFYSVSSRAEDESNSLFDYSNCALLAVAILVDVVALSAIIFRLASYGVTPNKIAALGENVLMLTHLITLLSAYIRYLKGARTFESVERWTIRFIPVYVAWFVFVVVVFPPIFRFE